jgi:hypothetical protein
MEKRTLWIFEAFLVSFGAFLIIAQSAHSNSGCVRSEFQRELVTIEPLDNAQVQRLKRLLEVHGEITADDLIAVVKSYSKSDFDQLNAIRKYVSKVKGLDGRKLVSIVKSMSISLVHYDHPKELALQAGLDAIRNLKAGDLEVAIRSLHGSLSLLEGVNPIRDSGPSFLPVVSKRFSPVQRSFISTYLPKVSDLDSRKLESITNALEYSSDRSLALQEGKNLLASSGKGMRPASLSDAANGSGSPSAK